MGKNWIETAPSTYYVSSNVLQDDFVIRNDSNSNKIHLCSGSNTTQSSLSVQGDTTYISQKLVVNEGSNVCNAGISLKGTTNSIDFFNSSNVLANNIYSNSNGDMYLGETGGKSVFVGNTTSGNPTPLTVTANTTGGLKIRVPGSNDVPAELYLNKTDTSATQHSSIGVGGTQARGMFLWHNGADRLNIDQNGYLKAQGVYTKTGTGSTVLVDTNGNIMRTSSSLRWKTGIYDENTTFSNVLNLQTVMFQYKDMVSYLGSNAPHCYGMIAESVDQAGLSNLVIYDNNGEPDAIDYSLVGVMLVNVVRDLRDRIEHLEQLLSV